MYICAHVRTHTHTHTNAHTHTHTYTEMWKWNTLKGDNDFNLATIYPLDWNIADIPLSLEPVSTYSRLDIELV